METTETCGGGVYDFFWSISIIRRESDEENSQSKKRA